MGLRVFLSLNLSVLSCPHGYSRKRGNSIAYSSRDTENKEVTIFLSWPL